MGKPIKIRTKVKGDVTEVKALMPHPMETGVRIDADTGDVLWKNGGEGAAYRRQPHKGAVGFGSIAPQGALLVTGSRLSWRLQLSSIQGRI